MELLYNLWCFGLGLRDVLNMLTLNFKQLYKFHRVIMNELTACPLFQSASFREYKQTMNRSHKRHCTGPRWTHAWSCSVQPIKRPQLESQWRQLQTPALALRTCNPPGIPIMPINGFIKSRPFCPSGGSLTSINYISVMYVCKSIEDSN